MNSLIFTIEVHGRSRQLSEAGLAILLGLNPDDIRRRVTWYLGHGSSPWGANSPTTQPAPAVGSPGEGGKGGMGHVSGNVVPNVPNVKEDRSHNVTESERAETERHEPERPERDGEPSVVPGLSNADPIEDSNAFAERLANALDDRISLACYRRLTREQPPELLERVLALALDVPAELLRRRRGAYFMGILRKLSKSTSVA